MPKWRSINSCPQSEYVLLTGHWDGNIHKNRWAAVGWCEKLDGNMSFMELMPDGVVEELYNPTHWQPLSLKTKDGGELDGKFVEPPSVKE